MITDEVVGFAETITCDIFNLFPLTYYNRQLIRIIRRKSKKIANWKCSNENVKVEDRDV